MLMAVDPKGPDGDCAGDGIPNGYDNDNDGIPDAEDDCDFDSCGGCQPPPAYWGGVSFNERKSTFAIMAHLS